MWEFPVHVSYHLVHTEPYKTIKLKDPIMKLKCGDQVTEFKGESDIKIIVPTITREYEYMNTIISVVAIIVTAGLILS